MKKALTILTFVIVNTLSFTQSNGTIMYSMPMGTSEVSYVIDESNNCIRKTSAHLVGLYSPNDAYPFTFDGLSACTQDRIADMNWLDKALCIIEGAGCVLTTFASCELVIVKF